MEDEEPASFIGKFFRRKVIKVESHVCEKCGGTGKSTCSILVDCACGRKDVARAIKAILAKCKLCNGTGVIVDEI